MTRAYLDKFTRRGRSWLQDSQGRDLFARLADDGDQVVGAFCGNPHPLMVHWAGKRYETCAGEGCLHCMSGKKPQFRVLLNFYVPAERSMKVIAGGTGWFQNVYQLWKDYGTDGLLYRVTRHGRAGDCQTRYTIEPHETMTDGERAMVAGCLTHDLAQVARGQGGGRATTGRLAA